MHTSLSIFGGATLVLGAVVFVSGPAEAYHRPSTIERVSVSTVGAEGNYASQYAVDITGDGRVVAFASLASNLVERDTNGTWDVFVRDRTTGVTERVSVSTRGRQANDVASSPSLSADGRFVAFTSVASSLVNPDTNGMNDVFVRDRATGVTERVSVSSAGAQGNGSSGNYGAKITADGRYVAFTSTAMNLVSGDTNGDDVIWDGDVFVHDRVTGVTERVSVASDGTQAEFKARSQLVDITPDGRYVLFDSTASNLVPGDTNRQRDAFVHDRVTGVTERVSVASDGTQGNSLSSGGSLSADGRYVTVGSLASNLVPQDANRAGDVFVHDRVTGVTERVSVASDGAQADDRSSLTGVLSADGRYVFFSSIASNLVSGDTNGWWDLFVHDRLAGTTEVLSWAGDTPATTECCYVPAVSDDGRYVAFDSYAALVPDDTNNTSDIFVRDRGPATGVGGMSVATQQDAVAVAGWARFAGQQVTSAQDPADDGTGDAKPAGAELTGASLTYQPEDGGLLVKLSLAASAGADTSYRLSFQVGGVRYEIRSRTGTSGTAVFRCDPTCVQQAALRGGAGITGTEVRTAVAVGKVGITEGATITGIRAFATDQDGTAVFDEVILPDATIPAARVRLGVAPATTPLDEVSFTADALLTDGRFTGGVAAPTDPGAAYRVWARACLGDVCGAAFVEQTP